MDGRKKEKHFPHDSQSLQQEDSKAGQKRRTKRRPERRRKKLSASKGPLLFFFFFFSVSREGSSADSLNRPRGSHSLSFFFPGGPLRTVRTGSGCKTLPALPSRGRKRIGSSFSPPLLPPFKRGRKRDFKGVAGIPGDFYCLLPPRSSPEWG